MHGQKETLETLFNRDKDVSVLEAAEEFARWTLPTVFTKDMTSNEGRRTALHRDYQSTGAVLVNSASTKVTNALFPQGAPFFRFVDSPEMASAVAEQGLQGTVQSQQAQIELAASNLVFSRDNYAASLRAVKLLMITGNALEYFDEATGRSHIYSIRDYTVRRDGSGNVLRIILKERVAVMDLPPDFRAANFPDKDPYDDVTLYTGVCLKDGKYVVYQEVQSLPIGDESSYPKDECPYIPLVWNLVNGEHYGRGLVEDYAGDFARLSELSLALTLYEVEAARLYNAVSSNSGIDVDTAQSAETGEYVQTNAPAGTNPGIWAVENGSAQKIAALQAEIQMLEQKLARAFMYAGNTRQGERVTAYEVRMNAQEAQNALGDAYSVLSDHWLRKRAYLYTVHIYPTMRAFFAVGATSIQILVGTASLNKASQADRLLEASQTIQLVLPVLVQATKRTNADAVVDTILDAFGVVSSKLMYTDEQLKAKQAQEEAIAAQTQQTMELSAADPTVAGQQLGLIPQ